jgi:hypothetical protein
MTLIQGDTATGILFHDRGDIWTLYQAAGTTEGNAKDIGR